MEKDPVCGMDVRETSWTAEHEGRHYVFCSAGCRALFIRDPQPYLERSAERKDYELVIVGGGPAGLTAAVYASLQHLRVLLIAKDLGGQAIDSTKIKNYMGFDLVTGPDLVGKFTDQVLNACYIEHRIDEVIRIECVAEGFEAQTRMGSRYDTAAVIVATGMHRRQLRVEGEQRLQRRGVAYRLVQEVEQFTGRPVAVIGGGNSGIQAALELSRMGCRVALVSSGPLTGDADELERLSTARDIEVWGDHEVVAIDGRDWVTGLRIQPRGGGVECLLPVEGVFIEIGFLPNADCVAHLVRRNTRGEIEVASDGATSIAGIYAAGDVTNTFGKRIIIAAGDGARAALAAGEYIRAC
jgi:alkyl hydroperoxide reductase subunit F